MTNDSISKIFRTSTVVFATILISSLLVVPILNAQDAAQNANGLEISPAIFEKVLIPDVPVQQTIKVKNITGEVLAIHIDVEALSPLEIVEDKTVLERYNASDWANLDQPNFLLLPEELRTITLTLRAPSTASPGGHYLALSFQPVIPENKSSNSSQSTIYPQIQSIAFLNVPGDINEMLSAPVPPKYPIATFPREVTLDTTLQNNGNTHVFPLITYRTQNIITRHANTAWTKPQIILPGTKKNFGADWQSPKWPGIYRIEGEVTYGTPTQQLPLGYGYVLVVPGFKFVAASIIFLILTSGIYISLRHPKRWHNALLALTQKQTKIGSVKKVKSQAKSSKRKKQSKT